MLAYTYIEKGRFAFVDKAKLVLRIHSVWHGNALALML